MIILIDTQAGCSRNIVIELGNCAMDNTDRRVFDFNFERISLALNLLCHQSNLMRNAMYEEYARSRKYALCSCVCVNVCQPTRKGCTRPN